MSKYCFSCGVPLSEQQFKGLADAYCKFCTDEKGNLKSKEEIQTAIANWFKSWQPNLDDEKARRRADHYMRAMPSWSE